MTSVSDLDPNRLRQFLDDEERFARSIGADDPRSAVAKKMLAIIADARASLRRLGSRSRQLVGPTLRRGLYLRQSRATRRSGRRHRPVILAPHIAIALTREGSRQNLCHPLRAMHRLHRFREPLGGGVSARRGQY